MSIAFLPVISSTKTTPKEYTSAFSVICPLCAYSGAKYLKKNGKVHLGYCVLQVNQEGEYLKIMP